MSSASYTSIATLPAPVTASTYEHYNIVDDFFGGSTSRHDRHVESDSEALDSANHMPPPPAYAGEDDELPSYTVEPAEPVTLTMFLFKFGFLFPLFWIIGAFILLSPLRPPPQKINEEGLPAIWLPEKTEVERLEILERMRTVEVKWARRCLWALLSLFLAVFIACMAFWMFWKS